MEASTISIISLGISIATFLLGLIGGGISYGRLVQKNETTSKELDALKDAQKESEKRILAEISRETNERNSMFLRKDVFLAQHAELAAHVRGLQDLKLPAFMARLEANQNQFAVSLAQLQTTVENIRDKLMEK